MIKRALSALLWAVFVFYWVSFGFSIWNAFQAINATEPAIHEHHKAAALKAFFYALALLGLLVFLFALWRRARVDSLSEEERAERERVRLEAKEEQLLYRAIEREARYLIKEIPKHLSIQNRLDRLVPIGYQKSGGKRRRKRKLVQFDAALITKTEIWFHVNGRKLPYGVSFSDLRRPEHRVKENLQYAIHRPVRFYEDNEFNLFIRIGLKNAVMGVPKKVQWSRVYHALPKSSPFAVAVGVNEYGKVIYQDLRKWPHGIVAGSTNQGKSTQLSQWIITLVKRNSPDMCQFIFIDLKDGVEFDRFRDLPHTLAFVQEPENVQNQLDWLHSEYRRRMGMFKGVCRNVQGWNAQNRNKLQYIFLIIDEIAVLTLDKGLREKAVETLVKLAQRARAAGIHVITATQVIQAEVLPLLIRANMPGRVVFSLPGNTESILILNNGLAVGLEPQGRCVYLHGARHHILQAPIATDEEVNEVIQTAITGRGKPDDSPFDEIDLFRVAIHNLGGLASWRELYDSTNGAMGQKKIKAVLKKYSFDQDDPAGSVFEFDGVRYLLSNPRVTSDGNKPRRLVEAGDSLPQTDDELFTKAWGQPGGNDAEESPDFDALPVVEPGGNPGGNDDDPPGVILPEYADIDGLPERETTLKAWGQGAGGNEKALLPPPGADFEGDSIKPTEK
ncbi:MAG: hypothetical protein GY803_30800 [Chloroflexi bacterium]|nr:hypothetical protein [Chloroflexota bacterium]